MQAEYFDAERPFTELAEFYASLRRLNRLFVFEEPFTQVLPALLGEKHCRSLSLLDLGAGDGALGKVLADWAAARGWDWRVINLDLNPEALALNASGLNVAGSVLNLPFRERSVDVVIASQMTHHLTRQEARRHLSEGWRVARRAVCFSDLHRNVCLYAALWLLFRFQRYPRPFRGDALLSVKRGWRAPELRELATEAGIPGAVVRSRYVARILLYARKPG